MPSPKEFADALRDERTKKRRRTWLIAGGAALVVLITAGLIYLFLFSTVFAARETVVTGNQLLTTEQVSEAAAVPVGTPLARVNLRAITERVRALPEVRDVDVHRDFPNTVRIEIEERVAVFQIDDAGTIGWVDEDGVIFRNNTEAVDTMPMARAAEVDERVLRDIAHVVQHLPDAVRGSVDLINARSVDRIEIKLDDKRSIVWGSAEESQLKSQVLTALLGVEAKVYDVSAPNHPTTR